jgi:membrane protease YdiL (CAAX protease family)
MPDWATFAAFAGVVTSALLLLSHASRGVVTGSDERPPRDRPSDGPRSAGESTPDERARERREPTGEDGAAGEDAATGETGLVDDARTSSEVSPADEVRRDEGSAPVRRRAGPRRPDPAPGRGGGNVSTAALLANVAVSQGLFAVLLLAGAWYAEIPAWAFGAALDAATPGHVAVGVAVGVGLYAANEVGAAAGEQFGLGGSEELRSALAPESPAGWAVLLLFVLPVIAGFEELLFRGALVGVFSAGFDVSPWAMAVVSSVAFALGHGAQGRLGVVVTGTLGLVLAATFVLTGSLLAVVVAHYLVNALEFVVHEGLGWEWARRGAVDPDPTEPDD